MITLKLALSDRFVAVFDDEGDDAAAAAAAEKAAAETAVAEKAASEKASAAAIAAATAGKTFTQEDLNKILATEKRKHLENQQKMVAELDALKEKSSLTSEQRKTLDQRIEALQDEMMTKEELASKEKQKMEQTHKKIVEDLQNEKESWRSRYTNSTIVRSITDAAATHDAYSPRQIVAILKTLTRLEDAIDTDGKATGDLVPKVKFPDIDKDGKPITLDLTPEAAVKRMSEIDEYLNLFKGKGTGGVGGSSGSGSGKPVDIVTLAKDPAKFREAKKAGKIK